MEKEIDTVFTSFLFSNELPFKVFIHFTSKTPNNTDSDKENTLPALLVENDTNIARTIKSRDIEM